MIIYKKIAWISFLAGIVPFFVSRVSSGLYFLLFSYTLLFLWIIVFIQKGESVKKIIGRLYVASLVYSFSFAFSFLEGESIYSNSSIREQLFSVGTYYTPLFASVLLFFFGLVGVVFYGLYKMYREKLDKYFIYIAPLIICVLSLRKIKLFSVDNINDYLYGWPFPFAINNASDFAYTMGIGKLSFPLKYSLYLIIDYGFYLVILFGLLFIFKKIKERYNFNFSNVAFLFFAAYFIISILISYTNFQELYIKNVIKNYKYCTETSDCRLIRDIPKAGSYIIVNKEGYDQVNDFVRSFPFLSNYAWIRVDTEPLCKNNYCTQKTAENKTKN